MYYFPYNKNLKEFSRKLRNNSTLGEILLWKQLRAGSMKGYTFNRQKPLGNYIVDFYCKPLKLVIEIDGGYHFEEEQKIKDRERQQVLEELGLNFLRFNDEEVRKDMNIVMRKIEEYIDAVANNSLHSSQTPIPSYLAHMSKVFSYGQLFDFSKNVFFKMGCSEDDANLAAKVLLSADVRGIDSHGIARLSGYVRLWEAKRINVTPQIKIIYETPSTATVDGDSGLGLVVAPKAMQIAMDKAKQVGTGWVSVQNSNHFGIAGYHAMMPLEEDMIGICMTNGSALVAPTFSTERLLGTNPISVAIPAGNQPAFVADMATTTAANGKLEILQRKQSVAPSGWIQNKEGKPSTDPHELKTGGALLPLGGDREHGSHKGYSLGSIVDIFSAVLSGANYGPWVPPFPAYVPMPEGMPGKGIGHFFGAMRIDAFRPAKEFKQHIDKWIERFRSAKTAEGFERVIIPGDPEREMEAIRMKEGIPLLGTVVDDLNYLGERFGIELQAMPLPKWKF